MPGGTLQFGGTVSDGKIHVSISLTPITNPRLDSYTGWGQPCYDYQSSESGDYTYVSGGTISLTYTYLYGSTQRGTQISRTRYDTKSTQAQAQAVADSYNNARSVTSLAEATIERNPASGVWEIYVATYGQSHYAFAGQQTGTVSGTMPVAQITSAVLTPNAISLIIDQVGEVTLTVQTSPVGIGYTVEYGSYDTAVAYFANDLITAIGSGSTTVTARVTATDSGNERVASCAVTVRARPQIVDASIKPTTAEMEPGETQETEISVTVLPSSAPYTVTYHTNSATVATFENGIITAVGGGNTSVYAEITLTETGDYLRVYCAVTVKESAGYVMVYTGGRWKKAKPYIRTAGTWKEYKAEVRTGGAWKEARGS